MYVDAHECRCLCKSGDNIRFSGDEVTESCEPLNMDRKTYTGPLQKQSMVWIVKPNSGSLQKQSMFFAVSPAFSLFYFFGEREKEYVYHRTHVVTLYLDGVHSYLPPYEICRLNQDHNIW